MTENIPIPIFEGKQIHPIEQNGEVWIPLIDLAEAWGTDRTTPLNNVKRNPDVYYDMILGGDVTSPTHINERGLYVLMGRISAGRLKNPEARKAIIRFQRWVPELIQKVRQGKVVTTTPKIQDRSASQVAYEASRFSKMTGSNQRQVTARMLANAGYEYLIDLLPPDSQMPQLPAPSPKPSGWLNATDIGRIIGKTPEQVNQFLYFHNLIIKDGERPGEWRITDSGKQYGEERFYEPVPDHPVFRVFWQRKILERFNMNEVRP